MTGLHNELIFYDIDVFLLFEIDDDFISIGELIEQSKYIIEISFCPWEIGTMSKYKTISILSRVC